MVGFVLNVACQFLIYVPAYPKQYKFPFAHPLQTSIFSILSGGICTYVLPALSTSCTNRRKYRRAPKATSASRLLSVKPEL